MKETSALTVLGDISFDEKTIAIHPNDGFDLGLMTTDYVVKIYYGADPAVFNDDEAPFVHGNIYLKNECTMGQVELSLKAAEKLGKPKSVRLVYAPDERYGKLLVQPV